MSAKTVFLTQYELTCDSGDDKVPNDKQLLIIAPLYAMVQGSWFAEVNGQLLPVAKGNGNKYQVIVILHAV